MYAAKLKDARPIFLETPQNVLSCGRARKPVLGL
jgi:hypothetical protein